MADKTVKELASISKKDVTLLLKQLKDAGINASSDSDLVSESDQES